MADGGWGNEGGGQQEQDFAMDGGEFTKDDLASGDTIDKEGWYHFEIVGVKNEFETLNDKGKEKSPCVVLTCNVLETVKGQCPAGSRYFHRIYVASSGGGAAAEGSVKSALRFGLGIGLLAATAVIAALYAASTWQEVIGWREGDALELGFTLVKPCWGQGLATEATSAVKDWAFDTGAVRRVWASCDAENRASACVLAKAGLEPRGPFEREIVRPNLAAAPRPSLYFSCER